MGKGNDPVGQAFEAVCRQILGNARNELALHMRFLDLALGAFTYAVAADYPGIGTDGRLLAANPKILADLYEADRRRVNRVYLHVVMHCIFSHLFLPPEEDEALWRLSCDIAAESVIDSMQNRAVRTGISRLRMNWYDELSSRLKVLTARGVYRALLQRGLSPAEMAALTEEFCIDDHSLWPRVSGDEPMPPAAAALRDRWEEIADKTRTDMETFSREQSEGTGDLGEQIRAGLRKQYDYRSFLRRFAAWNEEMKVDPDSFDYIFYSYGLSLYGNMPLIEPQEYREVLRIRDFAVVLDVSMSTSGDLVRRFLDETYSVLTERESYLQLINLRILQCDDEVRSDVKIGSREDLDHYLQHFTLLGGGGTDFRPAFARIEELRAQGAFTDLRGLIYFTDGKGIYPARKPAWETAFVFLEEDYEDREVPPWAVKLILEAETLREEKPRLRTDVHFV